MEDHLFCENKNHFTGIFRQLSTCTADFVYIWEIICLCTTPNSLLKDFHIYKIIKEMIIPVYAQYTATILGQVCTTMHNLGEQVQLSNVFCLYPLNLQMEAMVYLVIGITIAFLLTATMIFSVCQCITKNSRSNSEASKLANITVSIQKFTKKCKIQGIYDLRGRRDIYQKVKLPHKPFQ